MFSRAVDFEKQTLKDLDNIENTTNDRYELINGQIVSMGKASIKHGLIAKRISNIIDDQLKDSPCFTLVETIEVEIKNNNREDRYRPDVTLICPPFDKEQSMIENPKVVIEVMSKSSIIYDNNEKREGYLEIEGLKAYIVISQWEKEFYAYIPTKNGYIYSVYKENDFFELEDWFKIETNEIFKGILDEK